MPVTMKYFPEVTTLLFCLLSLTGITQWMWQHPCPVGNDLNEVF